jgi:hypothetical protein
MQGQLPGSELQRARNACCSRCCHSPEASTCVAGMCGTARASTKGSSPVSDPHLDVFNTHASHGTLLRVRQKFPRMVVVLLIAVGSNSMWREVHVEQADEALAGKQL